MMKRRDILKLLMVGFLVPLKVFAAAWNKPAFETTQLKEVLDALGVSNAVNSQEIEIIAADRAENGAVVQVEVISRIPNTESISIMIEGNPTPLIANFSLQNGAQGHVVTRVKMAKTSDIQAIIKASGKIFTHSKNVMVLEDGCGGSDSDREFQSSMKMRAKRQDQVTEAKVIIVHPMTTGRSKNSAGELIPAHFIQNINATINGKPVLEMQCGTGISKNPYLTFYLADTNVGDQLVVNWQDNQGLTGQGKVSVIQG
jgi:thiosulfate oxidation carrier complex protein SoxZ